MAAVSLGSSNTSRHDDLPPVTTTTIPAHFAVGVLTENWTDNAAGATTEDFATGTTTAGRKLTTEVFYPSTVAAAASSDLPVTGAAAATMPAAVAPVTRR